MKKRVVIIGGGVGGLSVGINAQLLGFSSVIYERHTSLGGCCATWERDSCLIDGCVHWLTGTKKGSELYSLWERLGVLGEEIEVINSDNMGSYRINGVDFTMYCSPKRLREELIRIAPEDKDKIIPLTRDIRLAQALSMPARKAPELYNAFDGMKYMPMLPALKIMKKYSKITIKEYADSFTSPILKKMILSWAQPHQSVMGFVFKMATLCAGNGGVPRGMSKGMIERMRERYIALGGEIRTGSEVRRAIINDKRVAAVELMDGETVEGDWFVSTADPVVTLNKLLEGKYKSPYLDERLRDSYTYPLTSCCEVFIKAELTDNMPKDITFECEPVKVGLRQVNMFGIRHFPVEENFAPKGYGVIGVGLYQEEEDYFFWQALKEKDATAYKNEKLNMANNIIKAIEDEFPELCGKLTLLDVHTPITYTRFTGAYKGAWMAFRGTPQGKGGTYDGVIDGLDNFYISGQWLQGAGGLPVAAAMGLYTVQRMCKREGMKIYPQNKEGWL